MNKRIVITAGGTAGHIYPAQAIIEYFKSSHPSAELLYIGTRTGMENSLVPQLGIDFKRISASGFSVSKNLLNRVHIYLRFFFNLFAGLFQSLGIIGSFKPDFVLGMGGYVCAPVFISAIILRRKIAIHEQNVIPGRLNRFFAKFAKYIFISFEESVKHFNAKGDIPGVKFIFSGDPVRAAIRHFHDIKPDYNKWDLQEGRFTITAFGGSLGAEKINDSVIALYKKFSLDENIQVILICGRRFFEEYRKKLDTVIIKSDSLIFRLFPYIEEMAALYRVSDLIISRAGATTVAELTTTNIPAILVPYPQAIENHQYFNAEYLVKNKKAVLIADNKLNESTLSGIIDSLLENNRKIYRGLKDSELKVQGMDGAKIISEKLLEERIV